MTKKDEFVETAAYIGTKEAFEHWREKVDLKAFVKVLNENPDLRKKFREAVAEAKDVGEEDQAAAGLSKLFGGE